MLEKTDRTTISRLAKRGSYDQELVYSILDEGLFCHVAYTINNQPFMIPTGYCRLGDRLYIHGSVGSHFMRELAKGIDVCLCVSLIDGLVLARSAFHHSVNYRSVVVFGKARLVEDENERWNALERFTEHVVPGRWKEVRQPSPGEMKATMVVSFELGEASAKLRTGGVGDDPEDMDLDVWAGVLPLSLQTGPPLPDEALKKGISVPDYVAGYKRG